jgi:hypothetical protein
VDRIRAIFLLPGRFIRLTGRVGGVTAGRQDEYNAGATVYGVNRFARSIRSAPPSISIDVPMSQFNLSALRQRPRRSDVAPGRGRLSRTWTRLAILLALAAAVPGQVSAGMSSENVIVVVNGDSPVSRTVANHYIHQRQVPTKNVIVLDDVPEGLDVELEDFRSKILKPVLAEIDSRGIAASTRVIAYSAGFPVGVKVHAHQKQMTDPMVKKYQTPLASINGLTYFYRYVLKDDPAYLNFGSNLYARGKFSRHFVNPFSGELKDKFEQADELRKEEKFSEASPLWVELHEAMPGMPGVAIRAAESLAAEDQLDDARKMILAAIKAGWWSSSYLEDTPALEKCLDDPNIQKLLPLLDDSPTAWQGPQAFSATVGWTMTGSPVDAKQGGMPYLCSCMLAVVEPNGSTLGGAVRVLRRAAQADRTFPSGRFAFTASGDVRAKTRFPTVADAVVYLQEHGHDTEIFRGSVPEKAGAIVGLMTGTASASLLDQPWILQRGAIAENLTSFGAVFSNRSQTKLTEFLAAGAAMSSGTVTEPYSLQPKFPTPMLYGYYARGLSTIESFYQSIASPYQLLIVGDPLTQPFAKSPDEVVEISFVSEGKRRMRIARRSLGLKAPKSPTKTIEVYVDDRLFRVTPPVPAIEINWPENASGVYDVRATLTGLDRTEPRISFVDEIEVPGEHPPPAAELVTPREPAVSFSDDGSAATAIEVKLTCEGADRIELHHLGESLASVDGASGTITVETNSLGGGPLRFRPIAFFGDTRVRGKTIVDYTEPGD